MKKLLTLSTLLCLCLFANTAKATDYTNVPVSGVDEEMTSVSYSSGRTYVSFTLPSYDGKLTITSNVGLGGIYDNEDLSGDPIEGTNVQGSSPQAYYWTGLTAGATYYASFYAMEEGTIYATYEAVDGDDITLTLIAPASGDTGVETDSNGNLTMSLTTADNLEIKVQPSNYEGPTYQDETDENGDIVYDDEGNAVQIPVSYGYVLTIQIGQSDNYVVSNSSVTYNSETGYYEWTVESDVTLYNDTEYPVIATLKNGSDVLATETLFTITGTMDRPIYSEVTVDKIVPDPNDEVITFTSGEDGTIVVTFTDKVMITEATRSLGQGQGTAELTATATGSDIDNGYSSEWTITIDADVLTANVDNGISVGIFAKDTDEHELFEGVGETYTFYYTLVEDSNNGDNTTIELESVSPDPNDDEVWTEATDKDIVFTFSGYVKIDTENTMIMGNGTDNTITITATGNEDDAPDGYSKEWTITVSADAVQAHNSDWLTLYVTAVDENEEKVLDGETYAYHVIISSGNYDDYTFTPANGSTILVADGLSEITIGYTVEYTKETYNGEEVEVAKGGISVNQSTQHDICIYKDDSEEALVTVSNKDDDNCVENYYSDDDNDPGYWVTGSVTISFDKITDVGTYTVVIPAGSFLVGEDSEECEQITLTYTISETEGINAINAAMSESTEIYNLSGQRVGKTVKGINIIKISDGSVKKVLVK